MERRWPASCKRSNGYCKTRIVCWGKYTMDELTQAQQTLLDSDTNKQPPPATLPTFGLGQQEALAYRKRFRGMIGVASKVPLKDRSVLSLLYTPGVAAPCLAIARSPLTSFDYTIRGNTIALVTDGLSG